MANAHVHLGDGWTRDGNTATRGHAFVGGDRHDAAGLARLIDSPDAMRASVPKMNGFFAIVHDAGDVLSAAVDHLRSIPLYYASENGDAYISDSAGTLRSSLSEVTYDPISEVELVLSNLVSDDRTLFREISQVRAGEYLELDARTREFTTEPYLGDATAGRSDPDAYGRILDAAFDRLTEFADGRQIAVALSGGVDSRLVASTLAESGYEDVTAFSYGKPGHSDVRVAERVADALDLQWAFVEYDEDRWYDWYRSDARVEYYRSAFNYDAAPILSAIPAIEELVESGALREHAIIVPGDAIVSTSEHVPPALRRSATLDRGTVLDVIFSYQYGYWGCTDRAEAAIRSRLADQVGGSVRTVDDAARAIETWDWRERQAKMICSRDEFEAFGHRYYPVLFDRNLVRFWRNLPVESRIGKALHVTCVDDRYESISGDGGLRDAHRPGLRETLESAVRRSPLRATAAAVQRRLRESPIVYKHLKDGYRSDPLGQFGLVPEELFYELYTGTQNYHSFVALDLVGRVSYDPPKLRCPPVDGRVDIRREPPEEFGRLPWF